LEAENKTEGMIMKRPIGLTFVVILIFIFGLLSIACFIFGLIQHEKLLGLLGFLFCGCYIMRIPFGLLKLRYNSWVAALIVLGTSALFGALVAMLSSNPNSISYFGVYQVPNYVVQSISLSMVIFSVLSLWFLMRRDTRRRFND
jgi:hypothetical protein